MLSLAGSLLGFTTSFVPSLMDYFKKKQDDKQELAMTDRMTDRAVKVQNVKLQMTEVRSDSKEANTARESHAATVIHASQWVINLSSTVRPVITYCFFIELIILTVAVLTNNITQEEYSMIWNNEMQAVWAAVVSFWFGARELRKRSGRA
jgi:hypothetical protein